MASFRRPQPPPLEREKTAAWDFARKWYDIVCMKIYTKSGDQGKTGLFSGERVFKDDVLLEAYGSVDELNSILGLIRAEVGKTDWDERLRRIQSELLTLGAELANPSPQPQKAKKTELQETALKALEEEIDHTESTLPPLKQFLLPGGTRAASLMHLARTTCRRAEREVVTAFQLDRCREDVVQYLNRLSDWCFVMARALNQESKIEDSLWEGPA